LRTRSLGKNSWLPGESRHDPPIGNHAVFAVFRRLNFILIISLPAGKEMPIPAIDAPTLTAH